MSTSNIVAILEAPIMQLPQDVKEMRNGSITYNAILQTANEQNRNKITYPLPVLVQGMKDREPDIQQGIFYGELDHPVEFITNLKRIASVPLQNACHRLLEYQFEGPIMKGVLQTLQGPPPGKILRDLIMLDKARIGISMRGFGQQKQNPDGTFTVMSPLTIIAYDAVWRPSHPSAFITKVNPAQMAEAALETGKVEDSTLLENADFLDMYLDKYGTLPEEPELVTEAAGGIVCFGNKCYLLEHLDKLLSAKVREYMESIL